MSPKEEVNNGPAIRTPLRLLHVEDSESDALLVRDELRRAGFDLTSTTVQTAEDMRAALGRQAWDIVISDHHMPCFSSTEALTVLRESGFDLPFILVSGTIGEELAVEAMKSGAHDYIMKNNLSRLVPAIRRELHEVKVRRERRRAEERFRKEALRTAGLLQVTTRLKDELIQAYDATIEGWARALDLRDKETEGHSQRVTELTVRLAGLMGISGEPLMHIRRGALLHDIGKMGIPDAILHKPGKLTDDEWEIMRRHPGYAEDMLGDIKYLRPAMEIPYCHHEKWDGSGYPHGLAGKEIPLTARIFAVVDVWDALCSDRPYRSAWPPETTREHIQAGAGTLFDPQVVVAFLGLGGEPVFAVERK